MIENSMVIGGYYEGCTYGECKECGMSLEDEEGDEFCDQCAEEMSGLDAEDAE
jgi:hypothetical protein